MTGQARTPSCVPFCAVTNPRSGWNKLHNICTFLRQISPDNLILSEHWGRKCLFENALNSQYYRVQKFSRSLKGIPRNGKAGIPKVSVTGGGVAIVYAELTFYVEDAEIESPEGIEAARIMLSPKNRKVNSVSKILVGGIYIAPQFQHKQDHQRVMVDPMLLIVLIYDLF